MHDKTPAIRNAARRDRVIPGLGRFGFTAAVAVLSASALRAQAPALTGAALAERMMGAFGTPEVWAAARLDHITAVIQPPGREMFLIDIFTRWDRPQAVTWVRMRDREQLRIWDGNRGWTANRVHGQRAVVQEWTPERVAEEQQTYRAQFERMVHRIARRDPALSFSVAGGDFAGWLEVAENGAPVLRILVGAEGNPERIHLLTTGDAPFTFAPLVSFGDHKQPGAGVAGVPFTMLRAELLRSADGIHFGPPRNLWNLDPTR